MTKPVSQTKLIELRSASPEPFNTAAPSRDLCSYCGRGGKPAGGLVPKGYTRKVLVITDTGLDQDGQVELRKLAAASGYGDADMAVVPAVRCGSDEPSMKQIRCCRPYVLRAIRHLQPELILAMGPSATRSVSNSGKTTNITKLRGKPLDIPNTESRAYATYPVSSVLSGGVHYRLRIKEDLGRQRQEHTPYPKEVLGLSVLAGVDTEYAPDGSLLTIALSDGQGAIASEVDDPDFPSLTRSIEIRADKPCKLIGHSLSGDIDRLVEMHLACESWVSGRGTLDSLLLARMKDENRGKGGYDLETLACSYWNVKPWKQDTVVYSKEDATQWPVDLRRERCRLDAWASAKLAIALFNDKEVQRMPVTLIHEIAMSLHRIRHAGVYIDQNKLESMKQTLESGRARAKDQLTKLALSHGMTEFNPTNDGHIRELLYDRMKLDVTRTTKKGGLPSVDKITLKQFQDHPEVKLLLEFNKADKAYTTNVEGLSDLVQPSEIPGLLYLPVNINPLGARTGRRSSERPNMQNWPVPMRQMVVSRYPGGIIVENDYKSLEIFILAYEAQDDKLFDYFATRGGYIAIARDLWKMDVKKGSPEYKATKSVVLGTNYNMQTPLMAENLWVNVGVRFSSDYDEHERVTDKLRNGYLDMFPGIRPYMERQKSFLLKHGYVVSKIGQVRHLPLSDGRRTPGFGRLLNQAINFPIQSLASAVTGSALVDCETAFVNEFLRGDLLEYHARLMEKRWPDMPILVNEVHDNLVVDTPDRHLARARAIMKDCMEKTETLRRLIPDLPPLKVDEKVGPHWGMGED